LITSLTIMSPHNLIYKSEEDLCQLDMSVLSKGLPNLKQHLRFTVSFGNVLDFSQRWRLERDKRIAPAPLLMSIVCLLESTTSVEVGSPRYLSLLDMGMGPKSIEPFLDCLRIRQVGGGGAVYMASTVECRISTRRCDWLRDKDNPKVQHPFEICSPSFIELRLHITRLAAPEVKWKWTIDASDPLVS
jgi:hypothetical protein